MAEPTPPTESPASAGETYEHALLEARRAERLSEAVWRQKRAEVARLVARGEEAAARRLLRSAGVEVPAEPVPVGSEPVAPEPFASQQAEAAPASLIRTPASKPAATQRAAPGARVKKPGRAARPLAVPAQSPVRRRRRVRAPGGLTGWLRERPPWALSLAAHGALLLILALASFATLNESPLFLTAAVAEEDAFSQMPTATLLDEAVEDAAPDSPALLESVSLLEPPPTPVEALDTAALTPVAFAGDLLATNPAALLTEVAGAPINGGGATGEGATTPSAGAPGRVSFFGAESVAERVAFVVDNSGSMQRGRMETTLMELDRAVSSLSASQSFYVVFFSDQPYPMFFPEPVDLMLPANRENKQRLSAWLGSVEMCLGGRLLDAVEMAAALDPQVVYVLSDGDIRSERIMGRLTEPGAWPFTIHTLGMGVRNEEHAAKLASIAGANGGAFRLVAAHPAAIRRAAVRPIPYHREAGPVWGSRVQAW